MTVCISPVVQFTWYSSRGLTGHIYFKSNRGLAKIKWQRTNWTHPIPDTIHQINGAQEYDRAITNGPIIERTCSFFHCFTHFVWRARVRSRHYEFPKNWTYQFFLSLFHPLCSSHNQLVRRLRTTKDRPNSPHRSMAQQTKLQNCLQNASNSQQKIEWQLFAMRSGLRRMIIWLDAKHANNRTCIPQCIWEEWDRLMKRHNSNFRAKSLFPFYNSSLNSKSKDWLFQCQW